MYKAIKNSLLTILTLLTLSSYAQHGFLGSKQSHQINGNQLTIKARITFSFSAGANGSILDTFIVSKNNSVLSVDLYYDIRGAWNPMPASSVDTITTNIDTNALSLFVNTILITYDSIFTDSMFVKVQTDTVFHTPIKNVNVNVYSENGLSIYPNPTNNYLHIEVSDNTQIENLHIYDINGVVVKTFNEKEKVLNLSDLVSGIYFVRLETNKGLVTKKILVE